MSFLLEKHFNFAIQHRAARGKTDYGIDILATKSNRAAEIETWIVQCKCYKPTNPVGASLMRELVGAIADARQRTVGVVVRGMMVTTSRFSGDALKLALGHGIQCVSGDDLTAILDSINRSENK
jgi:predicted helicase